MARHSKLFDRAYRMAAEQRRQQARAQRQQARRRNRQLAGVAMDLLRAGGPSQTGGAGLPQAEQLIRRAGREVGLKDVALTAFEGEPPPGARELQLEAKLRGSRNPQRTVRLLESLGRRKKDTSRMRALNRLAALYGLRRQ